MHPANQPAAITLKRLGLEPHCYVLVIPNSDANPSIAARIMAEAAARVAGRGYRTVFVGNSASASGWNAFLQQVPRLTAAELTAFIRNARLVISNDAATVAQALACQRPCVAIAIEDDGISYSPAALEIAALSLLSDSHANSDRPPTDNRPARPASHERRVVSTVSERQRERAT